MNTNQKLKEIKSKTYEELFDERFVQYQGEGIAQTVIKHPQHEEIKHFHRSKVQGCLVELEGKKKEYPSTDFNDGGDPEYRNRREVIDSRVTSSFNQAIADTILIVKKHLL